MIARPTLASVASLTAVLRCAFSDDVELGHEVTGHRVEGLTRVMKARRDGRIPVDRVLDVSYRELVHEPLAAVGRIYAHFDLPWTTEARARMQQYLAANPHGRNGRHRYSLGAFGLDRDDLSRRFQAYCAQVGIDREESTVC
jgi:hypothetical protein